MEPITGQDITLRRGASYRRRWTFALPGATAENNWMPRRDFTGCEARMEVRTRPGEVAMISISEETSEDGAITVGGDQGTLDIYISPVGTQKLEGRRAQWDMFIEWPSGLDVDKVLMGAVAIDANVTDPTHD